MTQVVKLTPIHLISRLAFIGEVDPKMKNNPLSSNPHADGSTKHSLELHSRTAFAAFSCTTKVDGENKVQGNLINNSQHHTARWA